MDKLHHALSHAGESAATAARDLRSALSAADAVQALVLLPMIGDAERLRQGIAALLAALHPETLGERP